MQNGLLAYIGIGAAIGASAVLLRRVRGDVESADLPLSPDIDRAECPHGMPGGRTRGLCAECRVEREQVIREEQRLRDTPCRHGVAGGLMRAQCAECKREQTLPNPEVLVSSGAIRHQSTPRNKSSRPRASNKINLYRMSPRDFESLVCELYREMGYEVFQTPYVNDFGRDAVAKKDGKVYLIECKRYNPNRGVGRREIQVFHSAILDAGATRGFLVTTGRFKKTTAEFVKNKSIDLITGSMLLELLREYRPRV